MITLGDHAALGTVIEAGLVAGETGNRGGSTAVLGRMAEATFAAGDRATTQEILDLALSVSIETGQPWWDSSLFRQRAELFFDEAASGTVDDLSDPMHPWSRAAEAWRTSLDLADRLGFPVQGTRAACGYADLLQRVGRGEEGHRLLDDWYGRCTEGTDAPVLIAVRTRMESMAG